MRTVGWLLNLCAATLHFVCGALGYRMGCRTFARRRFERVLELYGAHFRAYVNLGRIAFDQGDYATWRRELEHARRLDPRRFARLRHPLELFEPRLAGTSFGRSTADGSAYDGTRATWRSLRQAGAPRPTLELPGSVDPGFEALLPGYEALGEAVPESGSERTRDDCASLEERHRFARLGPIDRTELQRCDVDDLLRRLSS
jgi:hypothetical protein